MHWRWSLVRGASHVVARMVLSAGDDRHARAILRRCRRAGLVLAALVSWAASRGQEASRFVVRSPDGRNLLRLERAQQNDSQMLRYSVERNATELIKPSRLDVRLAQQASLAASAVPAGIEQGELDESIDLPWGKCRAAPNHCKWLRARFRSGELPWEVELRAYDEGVAFRYGFPRGAAASRVVIADEASDVEFAGEPTMHFMTCKNFRTDHENPYQRAKLAELPRDKLIDLPILATWSGAAAAITEGGIRNFPGAYLQRISAAETLRLRLSPLPSTKETCAVGETPFYSPWRVVLLSDEAGKLIESNVLVCLNEPPTEMDWSWARPGKTTWHWWNGTAEEGLGFPSGMNYETHRRYIDFCAQNRITYHAVVADDRPWYVQSKADFAPGPDTDILTPRPELELPRILEYAKKKRVGIRLWVHWKPLDERLEAAFDQYERWGVAGLMVDFLDRDDQEMVRYCERVLESAAQHRLHIQFHGSYKPSGEQRTFPHLFNREGVLNLEYLKWSARCTPPHNVGVAYTRLLAGPLDYHLGAFRAVPRAEFAPMQANPRVLGTRCHHLAMYVVYENPMPMVCDAPSAYEGQPGFEFLVEVPTTWDETRFVAGEAGEYIVVARRKGDHWYLGGMTNWTNRELSVPLGFLSTGKHRATVYRDGSMSEDEPNAIRREKREVDPSDLVRVALAPGGGFVAAIVPREADK